MRRPVKSSSFAWVVVSMLLLAVSVAPGFAQEDVRVADRGTGGNADTVLTKTGVVNGTQIVYTIEILNQGPATTSNLTVTDALPPEVTYVSDDCGGMNVPPWTWNAGTLVDSASVTCNITVALVNPDFVGFISNTATVVGDNLVNLTDDTDTVRLQIEPPSIPTLGQVGLVAFAFVLLALGVGRLRAGG